MCVYGSLGHGLFSKDIILRGSTTKCRYSLGGLYRQSSQTGVVSVSESSLKWKRSQGSQCCGHMEKPSPTLLKREHES